MSDWEKSSCSLFYFNENNIRIDTVKNLTCINTVKNLTCICILAVWCAFEF